MRLTTLIDNKQSRKQVQCEHGLSFLLEQDGLNVLFDTGQSGKFLSNALKMGIDMSDVDFVVLSHGHYDHSGGLPEFFKLNSKAKLLVHKNTLRQRFSRSSVMVKENGTPWRSDLAKYLHRIVFITEDYQLAEGLNLVCSIPRREGFNAVNDRLVVKQAGAYVPDPFDDEIVLVADHGNKTLLLCGCAHTGIVNILHHVKERFNVEVFSCVAGGIHLHGCSADFILPIVNELSNFNIEKWALNHCTGAKAFQVFESYFPNKVEYMGSGGQLEW
ncbi:MBL fold metallo-hydrolase [Carboxylicivirga sp. M1479]|uniref:MBL fold metallo-hydrolase n=1 Tax=Carboxylicivirga sp. M1479 TaxID=2594476 RepID=UPI00163D41B1|nr:MBL fold metallo-hydrolase [Carboxylicivirga sp. M1479]